MAVEEKRMRQIRDTASAWTNENPTLLAGEIGIETDTGSIKIGDGSTAWNALPYAVDGRVPRDNLEASSAPTAVDDSTRGYSPGSRWWVNRSTWWICTDASTGAAVWVPMEAQLPILAGYDVALGYYPGQAPSAGNRFDFERLARAITVAQNLAGSKFILDGTAHTSDAVFDLYFNRAAWGGTPFRLAARVTFAAGSSAGVLSSIEPDLAAGDLALAVDDSIYLHDNTSTPLAQANIVARFTIAGRVV